MASFDLIIIGGGIIGLASAMAAQTAWPRWRVLVVEKEAELARHQTGRNSGVIHSGLYYRPGSIKAKLCVAGAKALVAFCRERGIPYTICGKVVVATDERERVRLQELLARGQANGLDGLRLIGPDELRDLEPYARGLAALHVPGAGVVDFRQVALAFAERVRAQGGEIRCGVKVIGLIRQQARWVAQTTSGSIEARWLINCAGLYADRIGALAGARAGIRIVPFRGEYLQVAPHRRSLVRGMIYPVPDPALPFLGVHLTRRLSGEVEVGPNAVLAFAREGYGRWTVNLGEAWRMIAAPGFWQFASRHWRTGVSEWHRSISKRAMVRALQRLVPSLEGKDLMPGPSGVRAQAMDRHGSLLDDFELVHSPGAVHVYNAPSPAATASLAIGHTIIHEARRVFTAS